MTNFATTLSAEPSGYGVELRPSQIAVQRSGSDDQMTVHLSADYSVPIHMPGFALVFHFTPSSGM